MSKKYKGKIIDVKEREGICHVTVELKETLPDNALDFEVLIQKPTKKRGLDANALSWTLIDRIAKYTESSRDEIYDLMLSRYGVATYLVVKPNEADRILALLEHGKKLGDVTVNGKTGTQLQVFIGSSHYNREEFTTYLHGIISECENMGLIIEDKDVFADAIIHWDN